MIVWFIKQGINHTIVSQFNYNKMLSEMAAFYYLLNKDLFNK